MSNPKNVVTSMMGQHIPVPPNLGGPQKLTSGKYTTLRPRNITITPQNEPRDFEVILDATKKENSKQDLMGSASDLSKLNSGESEYLKYNNNYPVDVLLSKEEQVRLQEFKLEQGGLLTSQSFLEENTVNSQSVVRSQTSNNSQSGFHSRSPSSASSSSRNMELGSSSVLPNKSVHPGDLPLSNHKTVTKKSTGTPESIEVGSEAVETPGDSLPSIDSDLLQVFNSEDSMSIHSGNSNFDEPDMFVKPHGSQDSNSNNSGSTFKLWSQNRKRSVQAGFTSDDDSERDVDHTPLKLDLGDLYKSRSVDDLDSPDSDEELRSVKYGAMTNSLSHNQILGGTGMDFREKYDIQQRTDALSTNFSSFKLGSRSNESVSKKNSHVRKGMLDGCLDDNSS